MIAATIVLALLALLIATDPDTDETDPAAKDDSFQEPAAVFQIRFSAAWTHFMRIKPK